MVNLSPWVKVSWHSDRAVSYMISFETWTLLENSCFSFSSGSTLGTLSSQGIESQIQEKNQVLPRSAWLDRDLGGLRTRLRHLSAAVIATCVSLHRLNSRLLPLYLRVSSYMGGTQRKIEV
jgi:hypothetical protein